MNLKKLKIILPLLLSLSAMMIGLAPLSTMLPLWLSDAALPTWKFGIVSSSYFLGIVFSALFMGQIIKTDGYKYAYMLCLLLFLQATAGMHFLPLSTWNWSVWQFIFGVAMGGTWLVVESLILHSVKPENRGLALAAYMIFYYFGILAGQILIFHVSIERAAILSRIVIAVIFTTLLILGVPAPRSEKQESSLSALLKRFQSRNIRFVAYVSALSGAIISSFYGVLPLYLKNIYSNPQSIALKMALIIVLGILNQWPMSQLSNRYTPIRMLVIQNFGIMMITSLIPLFPKEHLILLLSLLGGIAFTLYPNLINWASQLSLSSELVQANQIILLTSSIGCFIGPYLSTRIMAYFSNNALFYLIFVYATISITILLWYHERTTKILTKIKWLLKHEKN